MVRFPNRSLVCALRVPRSFRHRTRRDVLTHVALVPVAQILTCIRNAAAMLRIVRPYAGAVRGAQMTRVEIVLMDERIIHDHRASTPSGMPAPAAPSVPTAAEEETDINSAAEAKVQAARQEGSRRPIPARVRIPQGRSPGSRRGRRPEHTSHRDRPAQCRCTAGLPGRSW